MFRFGVLGLFIVLVIVSLGFVAGLWLDVVDLLLVGNCWFS